MLTALIGWSTFSRTGRAEEAMAGGDPESLFVVDRVAVASDGAALGGITDFRVLPDGRIVTTRKGGRVVVFLPDGTRVDSGSFPVTVDSEMGLLGVEVHPSFAVTNTLFFYYSASTVGGGSDEDRHRVVSVVLKADGTLDMASTKVLVRGLRGHANHDGGGLVVGPDGLLYVGVGDGGCNSGLAPGLKVTNHFGGCLSNGNGKILRVRTDGSVPPDNPLVSVKAVPACGVGPWCAAEGVDPSTLATAPPRVDIWAWGFRNPWRMAFDRVTGRLWVGDVGEVSFEEIDIVVAGRHHGWPHREGAHGFPLDRCRSAGGADCVEPVFECDHGSGPTGGCQAIIGGDFVDACRWPAPFRGRYYFGDSVKGQIWSLEPTADRLGVVPLSRKPFATVAAPVAIHGGADGALYVASYGADTHLARIRPKLDSTCADAGADAADGGGDATTDAVADAGTDGSDATIAPSVSPSSGDGCHCAMAQAATAVGPGWWWSSILLLRRMRRRGGAVRPTSRTR